VRRAVLGFLALLLVLGAAAAAIPASAAGGVFDDVTAKTPFAADIEWLAAEGIAQGGPDGSFRPTGPVTRQAMAVFLYKFAHDGTTAPACTTNAYRDVPRTSPYCGSIRWLADAGITSGTAGGGFAPLAPVTRKAVAAFLYKVDSGGAAPEPCTVAPYADVPETSPFCGSIDWLWTMGVTTGALGGTFAPSATVTRGMMAAFLHRFDIARTTPLGVDVSHDKCSTTLPADRAFGIIGVNGGKATTFNPCRAAQMTWAAGSTGGTSQPLVQLYVNTGNPGEVKDQVTTWPTTGSTPHGTCTGKTDRACAYEYGRLRAVDDLAQVSGPQDHVWWLDVETMNTWDSAQPGWAIRNRAVLEAMVDEFTRAGIGTIGIYSTAHQWGEIVGTVPSGSNLHGRPSWLAGAAGIGPARRMCGLPPLTAGGTVAMVQFIEDGFDRNLSCS
jgi:hypothetical protein